MRTLSWLSLAVVACAPEPGVGDPGQEPTDSEPTDTEPTDTEPTEPTDTDTTTTTGCGPNADTGVFFIGQCVPDFTLPDSEGGEFHLYAHRGEVVIVDVIGMWCPSCRQASRDLDALYAERQADGLVVVTMIAEDVLGDIPTLDDAEAWRTELELDYPVVADLEGDVHPEWDRGGVIPMGYLIDREGKITFFANANGTLEQWTHEVSLLLDGAP